MRKITLWWTALGAFVLAFVGSGPAAMAQSGEQAAFQAAQAAGTADAYRNFLQNFPNGAFAGQAFRALVADQLAAEQSTFYQGGQPGGRVVTGAANQVRASLY